MISVIERTNEEKCAHQWVDSRLGEFSYPYDSVDGVRQNKLAPVNVPEEAREHVSRSCKKPRTNDTETLFGRVAREIDMERAADSRVAAM